MEILSNPKFIWFFAGLILAGIEMVTPGLVFIFFAFGAWTVFLILFLSPLAIEVQLGIFLVASVFFLVFMRKKMEKIFSGKKTDIDAGEGNSVEEFIGQKGVAQTDISCGSRGKISFRGTTWEAEAMTDIKTGDRVVIKGKESICLKVEKV